MNSNINKIVLAPMEGVADALMRDILTTQNNYDFCIAEFIRVTSKLVPTHTYLKICPELKNNGLTPNETPVRVQLLGQHPEIMAENAIKAIKLGSYGLDVNFGCPTKTVNNSKGGAILLKEPEQIFKIIKSIRTAIPAQHDVSAKIRLGYDDVSLFEEIVDAVASAGAQQLTIHARTKRDGYKPPAHWHHIAKISKKYPLEVFANGEIWGSKSAQQCITQSNTNNIMIGRGALALPNITNVIRNEEQPFTWQQTLKTILKWSFHQNNTAQGYYFSSRLKQWLRYLRLQYVEANQLFTEIKVLSEKQQIIELIEKKLTI